MRKNLTISLSSEDWSRVQGMVRELSETYSGVFHQLIQAATTGATDSRKVAKYKALLAPHAGFLADRAGKFSKARKRGGPAS